MAVPGAPQQAVYREIAEGYEKLAAHDEELATGDGLSEPRGVHSVQQ